MDGSSHLRDADLQPYAVLQPYVDPQLFADPRPYEPLMSCDGKTREVEWMVGDDGCHPCALCSHQKPASFVLEPPLPIHVCALGQLKEPAHEPSLSQQPRRQPELQQVGELH